MQKIKKGPTDVAETFRMSQLGSLELKFKSGQMANFWTDTKLQAQGAITFSAIGTILKPNL